MQVSTSESIVYNRSHDHKSLWRGVLLLVLFFHLGLSLEANAASPGMVAAKIPSGVAERLAAGAPQELIIEFDDTAVNEEVATKRSKAGLIRDDANILALRAKRYKTLRAQVLVGLPSGEFDTLMEYSHLPMAFLRVRSRRTLDALSQHAGVRAIYKNEKKYPILAQSLPLINQPSVASAGEIGIGTTSVVVDTGVDYTRSAFGSCTAPGVPASCKVNYYQNIADSSTALDANGHGTNVSGVVLGVATDTRVAMFNVFGANGFTTDSLVIQAMNWAIANQPAYHISAINLSLGDGVKYTSPCGSSNSYALPIKNAKAAGIVTVAASGNEGYIDGISKPACTPGAVSVGAVYDANVGGLQYAKCTDSTTAADQIACFSDSASFLTVLAPGAIIAAAGYSMTGTSQATPHVTGAVAVLRAAFPGETVDQTISRLTSTGHLVTDPRNGIVKPRINLLEAARPANDTFLNRLILTGNSGAASGINILATKEAGEPAHAANAGGKSVWWKWTAPAAGQVSLDTHGSSFNTLLAVYSGSAVGGLAPVAGNDNDGSANNNSGLLFQAQAGAEYEIAVDGNNGAAGSLALNWTLNTTAKADLSVAISSSFSPPGGSNLVYAIVVTNNGPQTATNTNLTLNLAPNLSLISMSPDCTAAGAVIGCSLGSLANGAVSNIQVTVVPATSGNFTTSATVSSDLPDLSATNSSSSISTPVTIADTDIPMLPWWGELMIGMLLLGSIYVKEGRRG